MMRRVRINCLTVGLILLSVFLTRDRYRGSTSLTSYKTHYKKIPKSNKILHQEYQYLDFLGSEIRNLTEYKKNAQTITMH